MGKKVQPVQPDLVPVWFELPEAFYKRLKSICDECGLSRKEALERGLKLLLTDHRRRSSSNPGKRKAKEGAAALGALRWKDVGPSERSKMARELALKRWNKKASNE